MATALAVANPAQAVGGDGATSSKDSDWGTGYLGEYPITNSSSSTVSGSTVTFSLASGLTMGTHWDALITTGGQTVTAKNRDYNATIAPGASVTFGFIVNGGSTAPTNCTLNGSFCAAGATITQTPYEFSKIFAGYTG